MSKFRVDLSHEGSTIRRKSEHVEIGARQVVGGDVYKRQEYDLPIYEHKDGLSVVPSCLDLSAVETELINEAGRELSLSLIHIFEQPFFG